MSKKSILVVGSMGHDRITTPSGQSDELGGSANYFSMAASLFAPVRMVGVVGEDYAEANWKMMESRGVDMAGVQKHKGKTFRWRGEYEKSMNEAVTLETQLNVLADFNPEIPEDFKNSELVFLANIDPELQMRVLEQVKNPQFVGMDTMDFWIQSKRKSLVKVFAKVNVLLMNEGEARSLTGHWNIVKAAKDLIALGPKALVIKRGEYGFMLFDGKDFFMLPAYPVDLVVDPTGAGDTFAGGFFGSLSREKGNLDVHALRRACVYGCLLASYTVQDFGLKSLLTLDQTKIEHRHEQYLKVICYPSL